MVTKKKDTFGKVDDLGTGTLKKFLKQTDGTKTEIGKKNRKAIQRILRKRKK